MTQAGRRTQRVSAAFMCAVGDSFVRVSHNDIPADARLVDAKVQDDETFDLIWEHESFVGNGHLGLDGPTFKVEYP